MANGLKVYSTVQLAPAVSVNGTAAQVPPDWANGAAAAPMAVTCSAPAPELVRVSGSGALVVPTSTLAKSIDSGDRARAPGAVPQTGAEGGASSSTSSMKKLVPDGAPEIVESKRIRWLAPFACPAVSGTETCW